MDLHIKNVKIECSDLKTCGEIAILLSPEKSEFFLNCGFCEYTFLQMENFIQHMYEDHICEFSRPELKQEPCEVKEYVDEEDAAQENYEDEFVLKDFERVEIELDTAEIDTSLDIKEDISDEFFDEEIQQPNKVDASKKVSETNSRHRKNCEIKEEKKFDNEDGPGDSDLLIEIGETKRITETAYDRQRTHRNSYNLDETQDSNNYEDSDEAYMEKDDETDGVSKIDSQTKLKSTIQKETTTPNIFLTDSECIVLAELYKTYTCLWDEKDIAYRFRNRREEALKSLQEEFNKKSALHLSQFELESIILRLRKSCSIEKKEKITCKRNKIQHRPNCSYYDYIAFLEVDVPPFECSVCEKLLPGLGQYKVHLASHDGSLPFKCHLCGHGFQLASNLTVHLRRHVHDYTYRCEVCNKPCATTTEIKIHMRSHTGEKPFVCSICGQKSRTSSHLLVHTLRHQKRPRHKCKLCSKMFYETGTLNEHMSVHRNVRDKICDVCNKGFTSNKQLRQHQLIHSAEKKYLCKLCGKRFAQFAGLSGHMKSHGTKLSANVSANTNSEQRALLRFQ